MGLVVIILILIITLMFIFGIKGDEWFNQGKPSHHTHYYYDDDEDEDFDPSTITTTNRNHMAAQTMKCSMAVSQWATVPCISQMMMIFVMSLVMSFIKKTGYAKL